MFPMDGMTLFMSFMTVFGLVATVLVQWLGQSLGKQLVSYFNKLASYVYPYITIVFPEYPANEFGRSVGYVAIERYLSANTTNRAKKLKANTNKNLKSILLSLDDQEEVSDDFNGIKIWWSSNVRTVKQNTRYGYGYENEEEKRSYKLTFHKKDRDVIENVYLQKVIEEGKDIKAKNRQRKLYTNRKSGYWDHILFEHPSTFDTLAMDPQKKKDILDDIIKFSMSKDYYKRVGKSWKRGYLLYGPPGTGKSSMIAAMANLLDYDIYDLELTSVQDNTDLRKLLIHTSGKSIIVIEDIDCSLDLTGQRKEEIKKEDNTEQTNKNPNLKQSEEEKKKKSEVTLSGLLNIVDGLWSACGSEKLIVFTTNYLDKLDPALIRRGRMDKHIELSYCCFETFKVLAKNYLNIESHDLFATIKQLLEETNTTPADVAENLTPKSLSAAEDTDVESCLNLLIKSLEEAKEAKQKADLEKKDAKLKDVDVVTSSKKKLDLWWHFIYKNTNGSTKKRAGKKI